MQTQYDGTFDQCQQQRISPLTFGPLSGGRLFADSNEKVVRIRKALDEVGEMLGGASMDQVALAWVLRHPVKALPLLGTGNISQMRSHVKADGLQMNRDQWFRLWMASQNREVP
jgi:predicted oxidoreductase